MMPQRHYNSMLSEDQGNISGSHFGAAGSGSKSKPTEPTVRFPEVDLSGEIEGEPYHKSYSTDDKWGWDSYVSSGENVQ